MSAEGTFYASREHGIRTELWQIAHPAARSQRRSKLVPQQERHLYQPEELPGLLQLTPEQVDHLIRTRQLHKIRICGEDRVDARDVERLIATYRQVAERKGISYVQ